MDLPISSSQLLQKAKELHLYQKLINQLKKDFNLANLALEINEDISPKDLKSQLHEVVFQLINNKFSEFLNLLYIIDVSEKQLKDIPETDAIQFSKEVTFIILKREWQKVWYKHV